MKKETDSSGAFIKVYLEKILALKYVYLGLLVVFGITAVLLNHYLPKVYELSATIGPVQETRSSVLTATDRFGGLTGYPSGKNVDDAVNNLNSFSLVSSTVSNMNLEVGYFTEKKGLFKQTKEFYMNSPFRINIDKSHEQPLETKFYIKILSDSTFRLTVASRKSYLYNYIDNNSSEKPISFNYDSVCKFNQTITGTNFKLSVSLNKDMLPSRKNTGNLYYFEFYQVEELAKQYLEKLKIEPVSIMASIIKIRFTGQNIDKSVDFLNKFMTSFLDENLAKKNKIALNTMNFIDTQISGISDSLSISESKLRNFRTSNQVATDLSFQGQRIYSQMEQIETEKANLEVQKRYYDYIIDYFKTNKDVSGVVPPVSANITDPFMNNLITTLISMNSDRSSIISANSNQKNLFLAQIDNKIKNQKQVILENVTNNLNTINITLNELNYRSDKLSKEISNLPKTEMTMVNIQRKFNLNSDIFTYLLTKRSEAAIALASNNPDYEVLEPAREITSEIKSPNVVMNYFLAIFLSLLLPTLYILVKDLVNNKISGIYDVEHILDRSVFGIIYNNPKKSENVVVDYPRSAVSETFRNLRSSLFLKFKKEKPATILITSCQPQDGKSFVSYNLAASIASVGMKTILLDCDLRRPVLHSKFRLENIKGLTDYMVNGTGKEEIIRTSNVENLSFIPAGQTLPNPSELIDSGALDELFSYLKNKYDYIIVDTPPVGMVSDSLQLMKYSSLNLIVARNNSTRKEIFSNAIESLKSNEIGDPEVILNDLDISKSPYSGYKNYYTKD